MPGSKFGRRSVVPAPKAPVLDGSGKKSKDVTLDESVFAAVVKPHLVHEAVRAELSADRAGTRAVKSRGLVAGGRSKPWRQKGTGRARAGSTRAPHWTGGGAAFAVRTNFGGKVNRKVSRAALRAALTAHVEAGSFAVIEGPGFEAPSTKNAAAFLDVWGKERPLILVVHPDAHKTQIRQAVEELFNVHVERVNVIQVRSKPKRRGLVKGRKPGWKKAIVQIKAGESIEIFEGAQA